MRRWMAFLGTILLVTACDSQPPGDGAWIRRLTFGQGAGSDGVQLGSGQGSGGIAFGSGGGSGGIQAGSGGGSGGIQLGSGGGSGGTQFGAGGGGAPLRAATCEALCAFAVECAGGAITEEWCLENCRRAPPTTLLECAAAAESCQAAQSCIPVSRIDAPSA